MTLTASTFIGTATNQAVGQERKVLANAAGNIVATYYPLNFNNEAVGTANGVLTAFTLTNVPVAPNSQSIYVAGVLKTEGVDYTFVDATGVATFLVAPANGLAITASYQGTIVKTQAMLAGQEYTIGGQCTGLTSTASVTIS